MEDVKKTTVHREEWLVRRYGQIEEVEQDTGRIVYRVKIRDAGREPFITTTFNDLGPATSFLERVRDDNTSFFNEQQGEDSDGN